MPRSFISLIHGVRRLYRLYPNRHWMGNFRTYLLNHGAISVACFDWNGGILQGFQGLDATRYAANLLENYHLALREGASLSIVSKSLGGLIAEKALALLGADIHVYVFLRIAVPDVRTALRLANVSRVVNVTSRNDQLFRLGKHVVPYFATSSIAGDATRTETVQLRGLTHYTLTEDEVLNDKAVPDATTYDLYWRLLNPTVI